MPLLYQPRSGEIVRCDFHGMIEPEMIKKRDVVVLTPNKRNRRLVTIIPLSTTAPTVPQPYHHELSQDPRPGATAMCSVWAKCDMVYTVSLGRLESHYIRTRRGGRQTIRLKLPDRDFTAIRLAVANALNLGDNSTVPVKDFESGSVSALKQPEWP